MPSDPQVQLPNIAQVQFGSLENATTEFRICPALCIEINGPVRFSASGEFIDGPDDVRLFPDVETKLWEYRNQGFLILGITNEGGVAFGFKSPSRYEAETRATVNAFARNPFHIIKACFNMEAGTVEPWKHRSLLRMPDYGMLAILEMEAFAGGYIIDWNESLLIGDRPEDATCANNAGIGYRSAIQFFGRTD